MLSAAFSNAESRFASELDEELSLLCPVYFDPLRQSKSKFYIDGELQQKPNIIRTEVVSKYGIEYYMVIIFCSKPLFMIKSHNRSDKI